MIITPSEVGVETGGAYMSNVSFKLSNNFSNIKEER